MALLCAAIQRQELANVRQQVLSGDVMHRRDEIQSSFCGFRFCLFLRSNGLTQIFRMDLHTELTRKVKSNLEQW